MNTEYELDIDKAERRIVYVRPVMVSELPEEVQSQAISYTTGVPAVIGAKMILDGHWRQPGVWNVEQCDPDPFMEDMNRYGLPWKVVELNPGFHLDVIKD